MGFSIFVHEHGQDHDTQQEILGTIAEKYCPGQEKSKIADKKRISGNCRFFLVLKKKIVANAQREFERFMAERIGLSERKFTNEKNRVGGIQKQAIRLTMRIRSC